MKYRTFKELEYGRTFTIKYEECLETWKKTGDNKAQRMDIADHFLGGGPVGRFESDFIVTLNDED